VDGFTVMTTVDDHNEHKASNVEECIHGVWKAC
jgi:hypothetical protein